MNTLISWLGVPLGAIMNFCYTLVQNYGLAILLFTLISKIILLPVSVWVHKNAIKVVKIQPEINFLKVKFYGDADSLVEEQSKLYKREKYNPFLSLLPLLIQIVLLMGLVDVIYRPLTYLMRLPEDTILNFCTLTAQLTGADPLSSSIQLRVLDAVRNPAFLDHFLVIAPADVISSIGGLHTSFLGLELSDIPSQMFSALWFVPLITGFFAWLLCDIQNRLNVLQAEQGKLNKYGTMALSVGLSLYLGAFVPCGLAVYWSASNLFAVFQLFILNAVISPKKYVDYEKLNESKERLNAIRSLGEKRSKEEMRALSKRERADYKRFFSIANKHIVFYSEKSGFYKYFEAIIARLLKRTNLVIHYVTSDPNDAIFELAKIEGRIKPYYIGEKKLITLFMKMDASVVVMTMSDLDNYHYKRSYVDKSVEYVYVFHYPLSTHMVLNTGALDHYDTILCVGDFQIPEIRKQEELHHLPPKKLITCGYGQLEKLYGDYQKADHAVREHKKILIAPSWQPDNILDSCIDSLLGALLGQGFEVVVRPHPEYVKRYQPRMDEIVRRYEGREKDGLRFELDFSGNSSIFDSDAVITDWSGTAYEFSFVTLKPAVFIDTKPKINNSEYDQFGIEPLEFLLRDKIGIRLNPDHLENTAGRITALLSEAELWRRSILEIREQYIANFGHSGDIAASCLIDAIKHAAAAKEA